MPLPPDFKIPVPNGVTLFPHQEENIRFAADRKVTLVADVPGLGKSGTATGLCNCFAVTKILIICPASLKLNWAREWKKFTTHTHLTVGVVYPKVFPNTNVVVINYELLERYQVKLASQNWHVVICDEAHLLKNPSSTRTQMIVGRKRGYKKVNGKRKMLPPVKPLSFSKMLLLTGTPMLNRPVDLWTFCQLGDPKGLGKDWYNFVRRYCAAWDSPWGLDVSGASNLDELRDKLYATFMIRHDKDLLDLPPKFVTVVELPKDGLGVEKLLKREMDLYKQVIDKGVDLEFEDFEDQVEKLDKQTQTDTVTVMEDLAATRQEIALKKLPMCFQFIDNIVEQEEKVIIFSYHKAVAEELQRKYPNAAVITGAVPVPKRQTQVDKFQDDSTCFEFIGQIKAAGVGLTLTAARTVVFVEMDYVPANLLQAEDRAHRISQDRPVNVYYLVLEQSLDATIAEKVVEKLEIINKVMRK